MNKGSEKRLVYLGHDLKYTRENGFGTNKRLIFYQCRNCGAIFFKSPPDINFYPSLRNNAEIGLTRDDVSENSCQGLLLKQALE